jgi:diaminopimelate decarboxylase
MSIHENGHLMFSGCDTVELAKKYETPLYVVSEDCIRDKCRELKRDFCKNMIIQRYYMQVRHFSL